MKPYLPDPSESRITAYALGELSAEDSAEFEKAIAGDPGAQAEVGSIRVMAALLKEGFGRELDAMFHPQGLSEPVPVFSVVDFTDSEDEAEPANGRVVSMPRVAAVALAAALVAAVALAPMLREQSGSGRGLAVNDTLPMPVMEIDGEPLGSEALDKVLWKDPAAIREALALAVPGTDALEPGSIREESPTGFHLTGSAAGGKSHHFSYIDPDILRMKSSIEAARRRIELAESLLQMAETSSEAAVILKELVHGSGISPWESLADDAGLDCLLLDDDGLDVEKAHGSGARGTVFRYGARDEASSNGNGFELGPVWWSAEMPGTEDGAE